MLKHVDGEEVEMTPEEVAEFEAAQALMSSVAAPLEMISKADLWRALTEAEAEAVDAVLTNPEVTPVRLRRVFEAAQFIDPADADYPALRAGLIAAIGEERANEILPQ